MYNIAYSKQTWQKWFAAKTSNLDFCFSNAFDRNTDVLLCSGDTACPELSNKYLMMEYNN